jgi:hypothetical protein
MIHGRYSIKLASFYFHAVNCKMLKSSRFVVPRNMLLANVTTGINKTGNVHITVTPRRVGVTTLAAERQIIIKYYVCESVLLPYLYGMQISSFLCRILLSTV